MKKELSPVVVVVVIAIVVLVAGGLLWKSTGKRSGNQVDSETMLKAMQKAGMRPANGAGPGGPGGPSGQPGPGTGGR